MGIERTALSVGLRLEGARTPLLLALAVVLYSLAAWSVAPGFYDGLAPNQPYNWVSPPAQEAAGNKPPQGVHQVVEADKGGAVAIADGQAQLLADPGAFPSGQSVTIDIKPVTTFPRPADFLPETSVYLVTATASPNREVSVVLRFSGQVPPPNSVYIAPRTGGAWSRAGAPDTSRPYIISVRTSQLGYFVAGVAAVGTGQSSSSGSQGSSEPGALPIIAAAAIAIVVLAALPLLLRRRSRPRRSTRLARSRARPQPAEPAANRGGGKRGRQKRLR